MQVGFAQEPGGVLNSCAVKVINYAVTRLSLKRVLKIRNADTECVRKEL